MVQGLSWCTTTATSGGRLCSNSPRLGFGRVCVLMFPLLRPVLLVPSSSQPSPTSVVRCWLWLVILSCCLMWHHKKPRLLAEFLLLLRTSQDHCVPAAGGSYSNHGGREHWKGQAFAAGRLEFLAKQSPDLDLWRWRSAFVNCRTGDMILFLSFLPWFQRVESFMQFWNYSRW